MYPLHTFFVVFLLVLLHSSPSLQQSCTPFKCAITNHSLSLPNPKANAEHILRIGLIQSFTRTAPADVNTVSMAKLATYVINNDPFFLENTSIQLYSIQATGVVAMGAATIALFNLAAIDAIIVETDEDTTLSTGQLAAAYNAPMLSLNSITQQFSRKTNTPSMLRMSASLRYETLAVLKLLQYLEKNTTILIYTQDTYGNAAAADFITQAALKNVSVWGVGLPPSGSTTAALSTIRTAVGVNWNVFVLATSLVHTYTALRYLNASKYIGDNYLHIFTPTVEKAFSPNSSLVAPLMDGALGLVPRQVDTDTMTFDSFRNTWSSVDPSVFTGVRPYPATGFLAYDAVMTLALAINNMTIQNGSYPTLPSQTAFVYALRNVSTIGLSGAISFDVNADRIGDYIVMNHIDRNNSVPVGIYSSREGTITITDPIVYFNGSSLVPNLMNVTINMTFFCSYQPPAAGTTTTGPSGTGGTTPPPTESSSNEDNSTIIIGWNGTGPEPTITGKQDPTNSSRCICDKGYGGDRCNILVEPEVFKDVIIEISIALGVITLCAVLVAMFAAVMLGIYWENFRKHGSFYCGVIILGVFFSYTSVLVLLPVPSPALCMIFPWFLGIGFTLVYGCLFIKTWTLYKVHRSAEQLKKTNLTAMTIIKGIGAYLIIEILILIIWTGVDRPGVTYRHMVDDTHLLVCDTSSTFWGIFAGTKSLWLVFGAVLSVLSRNVSKEYSESKAIAYATYNIIILLVIGVPLAIALRNVPGGLIIIEVAVILIAFTFTMVSLFFGVWLRIFSNEKHEISGSPNAYNMRASRGSSQTKSSSSAKSSHSAGSPRSGHSSSGHSMSAKSSNESEMVVQI